MAQATGISIQRRRVWAGWAALATMGSVVVIAGSLMLVTRGADGAPPAAPIPNIAVPPLAGGGTITYEVTGAGLFTADSAGKPIGVSNYDQLARDGQVATAQESVPSPDGKTVATIERLPDGVYLALTAGNVTSRISQLATSGDPALVAGGKGAARAVEGVPLVMTWTPDSSQLAFGSITGEPYFLTLMRVGPTPLMNGYTVTGGYVGELAFSPNGQYLAVSTYAMDRKNHTVLMLDLASGRMNRLIDGCHITWSPDSRYVAIHRDPGVESGAWVVSATDATNRWAVSRETQAFPLTWVE